jgi:hypothetical protein
MPGENVNEGGIYPMQTLHIIGNSVGGFLLPFVIATVTAVGLALSAELPNRGVISKEDGEMYGVLTIGFFIVAVAANALFANRHDIAPLVELLFRITVDLLGPKLTQLVIASGIAIIGYGAYRFKRADQYHYGIVEILVAICSAAFVADTLAPGKLELSKWATLAGSAYVVARGLENRSKGKEQR